MKRLQKGCIRTDSKENTWELRYRVSGKLRYEIIRPVLPADRKSRDRKTGKLRTPPDVLESVANRMKAINGPNPEKVIQASALTIADLVETLYFPDISDVAAPSTMDNYRSVWKLYLRPNIGVRLVATFELFDAFELYCKIHADNPHLGKRSLLQIKRVLQSIFQWALNRGFAKGKTKNDNPALAELPRRGVKPPEETEAYTMAEVTKMLSLATDPKLAAVLALLFGSGNRVSEVRGLCWEHYERLQDGAMLRIRQQYTRHGVRPLKTDRSKGDIFLGEQFALYIDRYRNSLPPGADSGFMFTARYADRPMNMTWYAESRIKPLLAIAGIPWRKGFHSFRRGNSTFVAHALGVEHAANQGRHSEEIAQSSYIKANDQERRGTRARAAVSMEEKRAALARQSADALNSGLIQ